MNPGSVNILFVVVIKETFAFQVIVMPVVAADELVSLCHIDYSKVFSSLFLLVNLALVNCVTVGDGGAV